MLMAVLVPVIVIVWMAVIVPVIVGMRMFVRG
jgi:hypothetical protein